MATRSGSPTYRDIPRTRTITPMKAPPMTTGSTSAQLKGDIDSGRTGDKNAVFDPGLSSLGTDDEAAGLPPSPDQVDLARYQENVARWQNGKDRDSYAHQNSHKALYAYIGFIALVLMLFAGVFSLF